MDSEEKIYVIGGPDSRLRYRRHLNPDGSEGGLVGLNAHVASTVFVGHEVMIEDGVRVKDRVRILDRANVSGNVRIEGDVVLSGDTQVDGEGCVIRGSAVLSGKSAFRATRGVIEGYTHLSNVEVNARQIVISGGEFQGSGEHILGSQLFFERDATGEITKLYLLTGGKPEDLPNAEALRQQVTFGYKQPSRDTRER